MALLAGMNLKNPQPHVLVRRKNASNNLIEWMTTETADCQPRKSKSTFKNGSRESLAGRNLKNNFEPEASVKDIVRFLIAELDARADKRSKGNLLRECVSVGQAGMEVVDSIALEVI